MFLLIFGFCYPRQAVQCVKLVLPPQTCRGTQGHSLVASPSILQLHLDRCGYTFTENTPRADFSLLEVIIWTWSLVANIVLLVWDRRHTTRMNNENCSGVLVLQVSCLIQCCIVGTNPWWTTRSRKGLIRYWTHFKRVMKLHKEQNLWPNSVSPPTNVTIATSSQSIGLMVVGIITYNVCRLPSAGGLVIVVGIIPPQLASVIEKQDAESKAYFLNPQLQRSKIIIILEPCCLTTAVCSNLTN